MSLFSTFYIVVMFVVCLQFYHFSKVLSSVFGVGDEARAVDRLIYASRPLGEAATNADIVMSGTTAVPVDKTEAVNRYSLIT